MKIWHVIITAGLLLVVVLIGAAVIGRRQHLESVARLQRLATAVQVYSRDRISRGQPLPASVSLQDLKVGGYVSKENVRDFSNMAVTLYPATNSTDTQALLVRVQRPDGVQIGAMADGSIQQLPK